MFTNFLRNILLKYHLFRDSIDSILTLARSCSRGAYSTNPTILPYLFSLPYSGDNNPVSSLGRYQSFLFGVNVWDVRLCGDLPFVLCSIQFREPCTRSTNSLMSSQSEHKEAREKIESRDSVPIGQDSRASPLRLSELSPRKINNQMTHPTKLRHGHPDSWNYENTSSAPDIHRPDALADAPISRKRSSRGNGVGNSEEEHIEDLDIEERSRKRSKLDEANAGDSELPGINVPKGLHSRHVSVKASQNVVRSGILASSEPAKAREARSNVNTAGSTYLQRQNSTASKSRNKGKPNYFCKLTVPVTTTFTGDLLRQKRAEAKAEREGSENGKNSQRTDRLTKSADSITFAEKARPPLSDKLVRGDLRLSTTLMLPNHITPLTRLFILLAEH